MGICRKHWKPGYETKVVQNGTKKPIRPSTEFGTTPKSFKRQSDEWSKQRESERRGVLLEDRGKTLEVGEKKKDEINSWASAVEHCSSLDLHVTSNDKYIRLCKLSSSFPPKLLYSIQIVRSFNVTTYCGSAPVKLYDVLMESYQHKLTVFSQIDKIVEKVKNSSLDFWSEIRPVSKDILLLCEKTEWRDE